MSFITKLRIDPDYRSQATRLLAQIVEALEVSPPFSADQRFAWGALERVANRFIGVTAAIDHPVGVHSPAFWTCWRRFVDRNARLEDSARRGVYLEPTADTDGPQMPLPSSILERSTERIVPVRTLLPAIVLDNETDIESISTTWGNDEAVVTYVDRSTGVLLGPRGNVAFKATVTEAATTAELLKTARLEPSSDAKLSSIAVPNGLMLLSEARKQRLDGLETANGDRRGDESHGRVLQFAIDFLGDVPLSTIQVADLRRLELALTKIPNRKGIPKADNLSLHSRYLYASTIGWNKITPISETTLINTYYGTLNSFLDWCRRKTPWVVPAFKFDQKCGSALVAKERDAFHNEELLKLFSLPLFTGCASAFHIWKPGPYFIQNDLYWGYIIHVFMGLRPSEIGQLQTKDIVEISDRWWVDLRDDLESDRVKKRLKSAAARRRIPIPRLLVDLGLIDRKKALEATGEERLFPNWTIYTRPKSGIKMFGHYLSKSWQYLKKAHGFNREDLTLYSGRHTLAGWYDAMGLPDRIRIRLLGHASTSVAHGYGPKLLTEEEALAASDELKIQVDIADILLTAKLAADYGLLSSGPDAAAKVPTPILRRARRRPSIAREGAPATTKTPRGARA